MMFLLNVTPLVVRSTTHSVLNKRVAWQSITVRAFLIDVCMRVGYGISIFTRFFAKSTTHSALNKQAVCQPNGHLLNKREFILNE